MRYVSVLATMRETNRGRVTPYPPTLKGKKRENVFARCVCAGSRKHVFAGGPSEMTTMELYDRPFDAIPRTAYFHKVIPEQFKTHGYNRYYTSCEEGFFDHAGGDFGYFTCSECDRVVCEQNPSNGWMTQYREVNGGQICLKCFEAMILKNGTPEEAFIDGKLEGMFFSGDNHEPLEAGYQIDERVHNKLVRSDEDARGICEIALKRIENGQKVIVGYESMAIGGLEGYVTLFYKET